VPGFTAGGWLIFYCFTTYMQKYLVNSVGMTRATASIVMTVALLVFMVCHAGKWGSRLRRNDVLSQPVSLHWAQPSLAAPVAHLLYNDRLCPPLPCSP
jgi:hypothetical protein